MRKIPTLFRRDPDDLRHVTREVHPDCQWVMAGEGIPTRKYDGTCVGYFPAVRGEIRVHGGVGSGEVNEPSDLTGVWLARREVKPGRAFPPGYVAEQADPVTGKNVGWEPMAQSSFAKFHAEAADKIMDNGETWGVPVLGATYELVGPKINGNPYGLNEHVLVRHGYQAAVDYNAMQTIALDFDSLREWLLGHPAWEGVVWHHPDGRMAKLKRRDVLAAGAAVAPQS
ncbi:DUF5565 family protein [Umezawaea tangerina]|uniref:Uncharacterized protein n=1 Tax=Umezawaea tangerina TaxID=84725 RepID=A0A2T0SPH8_9PSEU|nr:DUF5565 family protein [Umezawaea tangerina]PRY35314.1 hypothetical protein CLV43_114232 [Umezawaea tangerina]